MNLMGNRWSEDEVFLLKRLYPNISNREISITMKRSLSSINAKACRLDLKKSKTYLTEVCSINALKRQCCQG